MNYQERLAAYVCQRLSEDAGAVERINRAAEQALIAAQVDSAYREIRPDQRDG